jgi:hypothetical protein
VNAARWAQRIVPFVVGLVTIRVVFMVTQVVVAYVETHLVQGGRL